MYSNQDPAQPKINFLKENYITDLFNECYLLSLSCPGTVPATKDKMIDKKQTRFRSFGSFWTSEGDRY